ncbi:MAG: hypothetical protein MUE35_13865 [Hydrogenophaga sp.]|nr:hypothetical protein [Hydrogenophaga sp.]
MDSVSDLDSLGVVVGPPQREQAAPPGQPEGDPPRSGKRQLHQGLHRGPGRAVPHHGSDQHHAADLRRRLGGGPERRPGGERIAEHDGRAMPEVIDDPQRVTPDSARGKVRPLRRRLAESPHIQRHDAVPLRHQRWPKGAVLRAQVAHAGHRHHQRAGPTRIVVGEAPTFAIEKTRWRGVRPGGGGDGVAGRVESGG